jgi:hypothetical protein
MDTFRTVFACLCLFLLLQEPAAAYTDDIQAPAEQVFKAAREVLEPFGIRKMDPEKKQIESQWIEDRVVRTRRLLPIGIKTKLKQTYDRRYRIQIECQETPPITRITVKGRFQVKLVEGYPISHWQLVKPQLVDYDAERDFFFKILRKLEENRLRLSF